MIARGLVCLCLATLAAAAGGCRADDGEDADTLAASESGGSGESGGEPFTCGELECAADEACLQLFEPPMCENQIEGEPCPDGTTESMCGGAGIPCCCGPTPPTVYQCAATTACGDVVDCACLAEVCVPACSATADPRVFYCEELPAP